MRSDKDFAPMLAGAIEGEVGTHDFGPRLPPGVTISAVTSVTASVYSGTDPNPQAVVSGAAQIVASPSSGIAGRAVAQLYKGGIGGAVYLIVVLIACSDAVPRSMETHLSFYSPR